MPVSSLHLFSTAMTGDHNNSAIAPVHVDVAARQSGTTHWIVALSVSAGVAVMFLIVGAFLILYVRRRRRKTFAPPSNNDRLFATLLRRSPVDVVATNRQEFVPTSVPIYNSCSYDIATEHPQLNNNVELRNTGESKRTTLLKYPSLEEPSNARAEQPPLRSYSMGTLPTSITEFQHETTTRPKVTFSLKYVQSLRQIHLKLRSLYDLPVKTYGYEVYVIVRLFPRNNEGVHSRSVKGGKAVHLEENFIFDDLTLDECDNAMLRITVHYRKKVRPAKDGFLGELFVKGDDIDWSAGQPVEYDVTVDKCRVKKTSTSDKYLNMELGALFVSVEYQHPARRLNVMVRRATNLPKSDRLIGRPVHYVIINLMRGQQLVKSQETKQQSGQAPVWNQPFLFDITGSDDASEFQLDFVIKRGKIHTKDSVVGHVLIGPNGSNSGHTHWKEVMSPRPMEMATKWHNIVPVLTFKTRLGSSDTPHKVRND